MKRILFALFVSVLAASSASANPFAARLHKTFGSGTITVPPEWAGTWTTVDTVYDCNGVFQSTDTSVDTLCAGVNFEQDTTFTCSGTATSTTYEQHCAGSGDVFPDCSYTYNLDAHGTRINDTFFGVSTITTTYSGTAKGCDLFPAGCTQINSHATRTGPAPAAYCSTPTLPATWGAIKSRYR